MDTSTAISIHLSKRPIAVVMEQSNEKTNLVALQLMCIIDYYMEERRLYDRIVKTECPKLLLQLMKFFTFVSFKYYDYRASRKIGNQILRCKFCALIGHYTCILSHMAINHNAHIGLKQCAYCYREELKTHFDDCTFDTCYETYMRKHHVHKNDNIIEIVATFYGLIKEIAEKLNQCTVRNHAYAGIGYATIEKIAQKYGRDFPTDCIIFQQRNYEKPIKSDLLQKEFVRVIGFMYGGNRISRLINNADTIFDTHVIVISDDEDEYDTTVQNAASTSTRNNSINENEMAYNAADDVLPENLVKREPMSSCGLPSNASSPTPSMGTSSTRVSWMPENDAEHFGIFVSQRLQRLPDDLKRRKLEIVIQEAIVQAEKDALT
ncbi:uncharacterized protein LOC116340201 isoform X2 [Contarinia nasturtii]|uniref:uncharacterized protein LOC116340201 isoform X2 n=1 Tax=Contarinia nasturtii TaxID=265458 RepID=UPI0012D4409F|nr:uncharacterized protein LOC116340201 isoform X2 [Contarinia nasturtii]